MTVNVAIVGLGYWGPNLARNVASLSTARLYSLCDQDRSHLELMGERYPDAVTTTDYRSIAQDPEIDAVVVATPPRTHFEIAKALLEAGKHVLVEKPLAQTSAECRGLIALAESNKLTLMAGHVFIYNAAVRKVKEYITSGMLGQVYYIYSQRLNLGIIRRDVNALWNFAPHDLSIIGYWLDASPTRVGCRGYSYIQDGIEDVAFMTLDYGGGVGANLHISWLDPQKVRRMTVVGSEKMIVYDDVSLDARITIHDKGVVKRHSGSNSLESRGDSLGTFESYGEFQLLVRAGDVTIPKLEFVEPLAAECEHFVECVRNGQKPLTDGYHGLDIVQTLEAAQLSLGQNGTSVPVARG